jgi:prepilin-type processing-associated H-X9-DG protein
VIAIIAILAAILFPVFARARAKAHQATCQSNLKQVVLAWNMYLEDYDERTPGFTGGFCRAPKDPGWACLILPLTPPPVWFPDPAKALLYPYLKSASMAKCPISSPNVWGLAEIGAYGYNHWYLVWGGKQRGAYGPVTSGTSYVTLGMVGSPAETVCFLDYVDMIVYPPPFGDNRTKNDVGARHNNGWNVAMVDGHVKWYPFPSEINRYTWLWDLE